MPGVRSGNFKVAVLVSGGGTNLAALIKSQQEQQLGPARLCAVIASRPQTLALDRAKAAGLPAAVVSRKSYPSQAAYDAALLQTLAVYQPDLVVLAGFLTRLGPDFIHHYDRRIINIHPSLLPSFGGSGFYGLRPHQGVLDYGCKITGATVHFVDAAYDHGPILLQKPVAVQPEDTPELLQARVMREAEWIILPACVRAIAENRVLWKDGRVYITKQQVQPD
ncbi:MAG: phosphoribosylglycinamide formyltransferase [Oscillospiraceae bacterium]|nr:phosphoribosylglycinamide formyltransferase [Oscillospiraceae bacterium]MDD4367445.1 phosphoribosylglycinamide formyltransferase [Oscillospiraceae bacterium]